MPKITLWELFIKGNGDFIQPPKNKHLEFTHHVAEKSAAESYPKKSRPTNPEEFRTSPEKRARDKERRNPANDHMKIALEKLFSEHGFRVQMGKSNKNGKICYTSILADADGKVFHGMSGVTIPETIRELVDVSQHIRGTAHVIYLRVIVKPRATGKA